jgi:adenine-specific DNA-methyltransferase
MEAFRNRLACKEILTGKHPWWSLHRSRDPEIFVSPKFIGVTTSRKIEVVYDKDEHLVVTDACYVFKVCGQYDYRFVLGLLHSALFAWCYRTTNQGDGRVIPQVKAAKLSTLPIRTINFDDPADVARHDHIVSLVDQMLDLNKRLAESKVPQTTEMLRRQIKSTDRQIDQLVYKLYNLTEEEIKIVES